MTSRNDKSTNSQNADYDELSLHSHKSTNQSTERSRQKFLSFALPVCLKERLILLLMLEP